VTKKSSEGTKFFFNRSHQRKITVHKKRMPIVKCICGTEILVVPDLKAMNLAIDNHVTTKHKTTSDDSERLTEFLAEQVLLLATKINMSTFE
jgi:hypothetical protein